MANGDLIKGFTNEQKEKVQKASKYLKTHPCPKQELCPVIIQYWQRRETEYITYNSRTGKRESVEGKPDRYYFSDDTYRSPSSYPYRGLYVEYIPSLDALEISYIFMEANRGKDGEPKLWNYGTYEHRSIIYRDDTTFYEFYLNGIYLYEGGKYWNKACVKYMSEFLSANMNKEESFKELCKFRKTNEPIHTWGTYTVSYLYPWILRDCWYKKEFMSRERTKAMDNYLGYDIEDFVPPISDNEAYAKFYRLDENVFILRIWENPSYSAYYCSVGVIKEVVRIFFDNKAKGKVFIFRPGTKGWEKVNTQFSLYNGNKPLFRDFKDMDKAETIKYIYDLPNYTRLCGIQDLITIIRHPIIEKLIKANYPYTARLIQERGEVNATLRDIFNTKEKKTMPLFKMLGVNKYVLDLVEEEKQLNIVKALKMIYGVDDKGNSRLPMLSKENIDAVRPFFEKRGVNNAGYYIRGVRYYGRAEKEAPFTDNERKIMLKLCKIQKKDYCIDVFDLYKDSKLLANRLGDIDIDIDKFKTAEDITRIHDSLIAIQNARDLETERERNERYKEAFEKRQKKRIKDFEEKGEKYSILVPKELEEITAEGRTLSHCVGGYVKNHAEGTTNILFLRKNDALDTPFYTIEVRDGWLVQIHGKFNRWLGNDPDAIPFVYKWLTDRKIMFDKTILLNLGSGYGRGREQLSEDYLVGVA